jgi:hypothetical protein
MSEWIPDRVERAIRKAQELGEFDDLPGAGRPIPDLDRPYDPAWWARRWVERERAEETMRELATRLRSEVPQAVGLNDRDEARIRLEALNDEIDQVNAESGRLDRLDRLDVNRLLRRHAN